VPTQDGCKHRGGRGKERKEEKRMENRKGGKRGSDPSPRSLLFSMPPPYKFLYSLVIEKMQ